MSSINKDYFNSLILLSRKSDYIDSTLYNRVFENIPHEISELSDVEFTNYSAEKEVKAVNNETNTLLDEVSKNIEDIYFVALSSSIYNLLLNKVKIPTAEAGMTDKLKIKKCKIELCSKVDKATRYQILTMLSFLNIPIGKPIVILESTLSNMENRFHESLKIEILSEISVFCKNIVLNTLDGPYDFLSSSNQTNYKLCINSILKYKALNPETNQDNFRLDNLQYYLINEQIRIYIYDSFKSIISKNFVKFQDNKSWVDFSGNLSFSVSTPSENFKTPQFFNFKQISEYVIAQGFFVSYADATDKVYFGESKSMSEQEDLEPIYYQSDEGNEIYSLLFRLCDKKFANYEGRIDDLISTQKYTELEDLLAEMIYL